ncbi:hypothetical protein BUALT_Bualt01G0163400 [Buddleja alternifolia]|uniref:Uncharacterized protein n=1 Tax=Buddleja alternifolia TaxID=168488 RepID=A0AAV6Y989_9LAMI|nr:hypothetical protein BUALT_Bualt01G0163400 [Buddleja alternifolia]
MFPQNERSDSIKHLFVTCQEFSNLLESSQPRERRGSYRRQIHRVPPQLKRNEKEHVYEPLTVSLGPYHHGKPDLRRAEEFKYTSLHWCASGSDEKKSFFYNKVLEGIDEIRGCYADVSIVDNFDDKALALMMLLDACFLINFMETRTRTESNFEEWRNRLGMAAAIPFTSRDIMVLENQIPFQFMGWMMIRKTGMLVTIPGEDKDPPRHILEACWRVVVGENCHNESSHQQSGITFHFRWPRFMRRLKKKDQRYDNREWTSQTGRSIMDLKAKGIKFEPSLSTSIRDVKFNSFAFHGHLQLPVGYISESTRVTLSNMIAYEISPDSNNDLALLSYTSFLKSLIQSPNDVKELQEKGILFNKFSNNEEVVKILKEIYTFGLVNFNIYEDVNLRIREHCNSKSKTWMADLIHTCVDLYSWQAYGSFYQGIFRFLTTTLNDPNRHEDFRPASKIESSSLSLKDIAEQDIKENPAMIYMRGVLEFPRCGFGALAVRVLKYIVSLLNLISCILLCSSFCLIRSRMFLF